MADKIKDYTNAEIDEFSDLEKEAHNRANKLNKQLIHINALLEELDNDWKEYNKFLEDEKISKICEFYGDTRVAFDEELLTVIVENLKESLTELQHSLNYNSKKIGLNRVIKG